MRHLLNELEHLLNEVKNMTNQSKKTAIILNSIILCIGPGPSIRYSILYQINIVVLGINMACS